MLTGYKRINGSQCTLVFITEGCRVYYMVCNNIEFLDCMGYSQLSSLPIQDLDIDRPFTVLPVDNFYFIFEWITVCLGIIEHNSDRSPEW